jgi:hypothetical protein
MSGCIPVSPKAVPAIKIITYDGLVPRNSRADVAYQLHYYEPRSGGADTSQSRQQSLLFAARTDIIARMENRLNKARAPSYSQGVESKAPIYDGFGYSLVMKGQETFPDQKNHEYLVVAMGCHANKGRYSTMRFGRALKAMTWPSTWNIMLSHEHSSEYLQYRERVKTAYRISGG